MEETTQFITGNLCGKVDCLISELDNFRKDNKNDHDSIKSNIKIIVDSQVQNREEIAKHNVNMSNVWKTFMVGGSILSAFSVWLWSHITSYGIHIIK